MRPRTPGDDVLTDAARVAAHSLGVPYAGIELFDAPGVYHEWGRRTNPWLIVPLEYRGRAIGRLSVVPVRPLCPTEEQLLRAVAAQIALTAHAQRATRRIVVAREQERRSLRRELHDGLGPTLAAMTLTLDAARNLLGRDRQTVDGLLGGMRDQSQGAIAEVRRLSAQLRPPALDQLGLAGAIREQFDVRLDAPERLDELPAAVEVAVLEIVRCAMAGAVGESSVRLGVGESVTLEIEHERVSDGWPDAAALKRLIACACEIGGTCSVDGPFRVSAQLPVRDD